MKKLTIAALTTALLAGAASANQTGFFVGVGAVSGAVTGQYQDKNDATPGNSNDFTRTVIRGNSGKTLFGGRLEAGYGITFAGCGYASISVYGTLKSAKWTPATSFDSPNASKLSEAKARVKHDFGVEVKLGYHITKDTIGFIGIAAEANKTELTWTQTHATTAGLFRPTLKKSKSAVSAKPVIGLRTMFTKNMYLEAKYGYNFGSKVTLNVPNDALGIATGTGAANVTTRTVSLRPRTHEFSVTIGWRF